MHFCTKGGRKKPKLHILRDGQSWTNEKIPIVSWFGLKYVAQIFYTHFSTKFGTKSSFLYYGLSKKPKILQSKGWVILDKQKNTYCALVCSKPRCTDFLQALFTKCCTKSAFLYYGWSKNPKLHILRDGQSWTNEKNTYCALVWSKTCCTNFLQALFYEIWY